MQLLPGFYLPGLAIAVAHGPHDGVHHLTGEVQQAEVIGLHKAVGKGHPFCPAPASQSPSSSAVLLKLVYKQPNPLFFKFCLMFLYQVDAAGASKCR